MRLIIIVLLILFVLSCTRTQEKLFTANELCRSKEYLNDPNNMRDQYDNCFLFTDEDLKSQEGCRLQCQNYCEGLEMDLQDIKVDLAGCRCICETMSQQD